MKQLIMRGILNLIGMSVRKEAEKTPNGIVGRFGAVMKFLPIIGIFPFVGFGIMCLNDPDERFMAVFGFGLAAVFVGAVVHFATFKLRAEGDMIYWTSMVAPDKSINLGEPFDAELEADGKTMHLRQQKTKISINWMISGYLDFFRIIEKRLVDRENQMTEQGVDPNA